MIPELALLNFLTDCKYSWGETILHELSHVYFDFKGFTTIYEEEKCEREVEEETEKVLDLIGNKIDKFKFKEKAKKKLKKNEIADSTIFKKCCDIR